MVITVTVIETGDTAEAETTADAFCAGRTMGWEAKESAATQGFDPGSFSWRTAA